MKRLAQFCVSLIFFIHKWILLIFLWYDCLELNMKWGTKMAVIRVEKTQNYTVMSNEHLRNKDLSLKAKGLMTLMLSLPPTWDYSIGGLVAICKESHTSIRSAIKELEENRYLVRERKNNEKGYFIYEYTLYETQQPYAGNQHAVEKHAEKQRTENGTQLNKEKINTDKLNKDEKNIDINIGDYSSLLDEVKNDQLRNLYVDYIEMRRNIGSPITLRGLSMLMTRWERIAVGHIEKQKRLLETAIINGWKNVYEPKEDEVKKEQLRALKELYFGE